MTAYTPEQFKRLGVHLLNAEPRSALHGGVRMTKPSRFRRLLWVCQEIAGAILTMALAIIVPVAIYLVLGN